MTDRRDMAVEPNGHHGVAVDERRKRLTESAFIAPQERVRPRTDLAGGALRRSLPTAEIVTDGYHQVRMKLHVRLLNEMERKGILEEGDESVREYVREFVRHVLAEEDLPLNDHERRTLADDLQQETFGIGPLAELMADPAVTDILVNGPESVYVERFGILEKTGIRFRDNTHLVRIIQRIASSVGRHVDEASPMVDARLPDGSRVNATIPPVSIDGPVLCIRRFGRLRLGGRELLNLGMLTNDMMRLLAAAIKARLSILVSGGAGAGKSTLLGALAEAIPANERLITVEDAAELRLPQEHVVRLETRLPNIEGKGRITTRDLVINSLRMRPDRLIVGEVRGPEALDMLQAMNTGHEGSLTTIHSNSTRDALSRLETMVMMAGADLPVLAVREQIASAMRLVVHLRRYEDGVRRIQTISEITGLEDGSFVLQDLYRFERTGYGRDSEQGLGYFESTGVVPACLDALEPVDEGLTSAFFERESSADG